MKATNDAALILIHYLGQEPDLFDDGHPRPSYYIPHWFKGLNPQAKFTAPRPQYKGPIDQGVLDRIEAWDEDPCFDLSNPEIPENWTKEELQGLKIYEDAVNQWKRDKYQFELVQELILFRKWIYWLTRFTNMDIFDRQVMQFAGLIPPDEEDQLPPDEE